MKLWKAMKLLDENPTDVYVAELASIGWTVRMTVEDELRGYYHFEVFNGKRLIDQSLGGGAFNGNVALNLDWQLVRQPVPWHEAVTAWACGNKVRVELDGGKYMFQGFGGLAIARHAINEGTWYVED